MPLNMIHTMDGIYAMFYTGTVGSGHAIVILRNGVLAGADALGGIYDGSFELLADGSLDVDVSLRFPPGTLLVSGDTVGPNGLNEDFKCNLPSDLGGGDPLLLHMPFGPVNFLFQRLRSTI